VQTITVQDTTKPTIQCPSDRLLDCPANTTTNFTGVATAQDVCGQVTITYSDSVTNKCTGTKVIIRTWTATDQCANSSSCVQTITVQDIAKPVLTIPTNRVLQCPADTRTNATGVATATDTCSPAAIRYSDVVTTNCGGTRLIARTWTATDECGNAVSAVQTITLEDTTPPTLTCPPNQTLQCPADTRTNVTGVATASDVCSGVTITYADTTQNNCSGTKVIQRTWTATDQCGNRQSCVQTITVIDTIKPTISVPADQVLDCPANTAPSATGTATGQDGCSQVTITYNDT
jgi:large repetitive protein